MEAIQKREAWNKGKLVGQKPPLKPKDIWAIRVTPCGRYLASCRTRTTGQVSNFMSPLLFHLDANAVNARQRDSDLNELERLASDGVVELEYSQVAYDEAANDTGMREAKAEKLTWAGLSNQPDLEASWRKQIANAVFPKGVMTHSQRNDVEILLTAKLAGAILVTGDGASKSQPRGILGSRRELDALGIRVVTASEAVALANATGNPKITFNII